MCFVTRASSKVHLMNWPFAKPISWTENGRPATVPVKDPVTRRGLNGAIIGSSSEGHGDVDVHLVDAARVAERAGAAGQLALRTNRRVDVGGAGERQRRDRIGGRARRARRDDAVPDAALDRPEARGPDLLDVLVDVRNRVARDE